MRRPISMTKLGFVSLLTGLLVAGCNSGPQDKAEHSTKSSEAQVRSPQVEGEAVVWVDSDQTAQELSTEYQVTIIDQEDGAVLVRTRSDQTTDEVRMDVATHSGVRESEPNYLVFLDESAPRDPKWLSLWGLKNYGQDAPNGYEGNPGSDIGATDAWKLSQGSHEVLVGIIDTGIDYTHPDLQANIYVNEAEKNGIPGEDDDGNGYADDVYGWNFINEMTEKPYHGQLGNPDPMDDHGHGTHCAGTIGAVGNNGVGVIGVSPVVKIMGLKFLSAAGSGTTVDAYRAVMYGANAGVDILSNSWGGTQKSKLMEKAVAYALEKGVLFIAAAGNNGTSNDFEPHYPSNYEVANVLSVAASNNADNLAGFSNYGYETVHLAAPGVSIMSTFPVQLAENEAKNEGLPELADPYRAWSGTSMATPHVSGAAALLLAHRPELRKKPIEAKAALMNTVDVLPQLAGKVSSGGRLNVRRALEGDGNVGEGLEFVEEPITIESPRYPTERVNQTWSHTVEGARFMKVHFKRLLIDPAFDLVMLMDSQNRMIMEAPEYLEDHWSPIIPGDTVQINFQNALVAINHYKGKKKYQDPEKAVEDGAVACLVAADGGYICEMFEMGDPFANFSSDGFEIDKIAYVKGE